MRYKKTIISFCLLVLALSGSYAQELTETRNLARSFLAGSDIKLDISNKYGTINLSRSETDSVTMKVEIRATSSSRSKLRTIIDGVTVDMNASQFYIIGRTNFSNGKMGFLEVIRKVTNNLISSESRLEVNWWVSVPEGIPVELENRYGDIFIGSIDNDLKVTLSNGALQAEDLFGDNWFKLDFFDARFNMVRKAGISASYGDISVNTAGAIDFRTVSSRIDIGNIETMNYNSKRDKFYIKEVSSITGESYFTDFEIGLLDRVAEVTARYGTVSINSQGDSSERIKLVTNYTGVRLNIDNDRSYSFDLKSNKCNIYIPDNLNLEETSLSEESEIYFYSGNIGKEGNPTRIIMDMTRGSLSVRENMKDDPGLPDNNKQFENL